MSSAVTSTHKRPRLPRLRLPTSRLFNGTGRAGPRRLAAIALITASGVAVVVLVALGGQTYAPVSQVSRLAAIDPLPGGLNSTPEQDALRLAATDQQAHKALEQGSSYTPPMAPSLPVQPEPPRSEPTGPRIADNNLRATAGRPVRVTRPVSAPIFPVPVPVAFAATEPQQQMRPTTVAATPEEQQAEQATARQINDLFSQWGGHLPRTDVILPPDQQDSDGPEATAASRHSGDSQVRPGASAPAVPIKAADSAEVLIPAGRGVYAHPVLALSSDEASPVVLQADSGPIAGDRMIGTFSKQANRLVIHVGTIIHNGENIPCDGVVTAPDTMEASVASGVDEHYVARFLLPAAAAFVQGLGQAIAQTSNSTSVLSPFGGATTSTHLNIDQQLGVAAGAAAQQVGAVLNQEAPKGPTISLEANVAVGVMFLSTVTTRRAQ